MNLVDLYRQSFETPHPTFTFEYDGGMTFSGIQWANHLLAKQIKVFNPERIWAFKASLYDDDQACLGYIEADLPPYHDLQWLIQGIYSYIRQNGLFVAGPPFQTIYSGYATLYPQGITFEMKFEGFFLHGSITRQGGSS